MQKILLLFVTFLFGGGTVFSQTDNPGNTDNQFWNETQLIFPLIKKEAEAGKTTEKVSLLVTGNFRIGQDISRFIDKRIGFGLDYKHNKHISFAPSYLYIAQRPARVKKQSESRLRLAVNLENSWKRFSLKDRNLFEYRFRNNNSNSARYRNRLTFQYPVRKGKKELLVPYAANEVFYDFKAKTFTRDEISFGVSRKLTPKVSGDFYYLLQINKNTALKYLNVFGINLKIKVD